jgi:hypothetical protein
MVPKALNQRGTISFGTERLGPAACRLPQTGPLLGPHPAPRPFVELSSLLTVKTLTGMTTDVYPFLGTPLLQSKSKIRGSRVRQ